MREILSRWVVLLPVEGQFFSETHILKKVVFVLSCTSLAQVVVVSPNKLCSRELFISNIPFRIAWVLWNLLISKDSNKFNF